LNNFHDFIINTRLTFNNALDFLQQLLTAISQMHQRRIAHQDITSKNILIDQSQRLTIIDFGLAEQFESRAPKATSWVGTMHYNSPEALDSSVASPFDPFKNDIWAIGVVFYQVLTRGQKPFYIWARNGFQFDPSKEWRVALNKQSASALPILQKKCEKCVELLDYMLQIDPNKRKSAQWILKKMSQ
jgi:serine/threonine protein kinase